jgi:hypothetical protein
MKITPFKRQSVWVLIGLAIITATIYWPFRLRWSSLTSGEVTLRFAVSDLRSAAQILAERGGRIGEPAAGRKAE